MADDRSLRILLVDDDNDLLELLEYNFRKEGFKVRTVNNVQQAIGAARRFQPQLIILDVMMPDGNGIDLCRELRSLSNFEDTIVFFLSACAEESYREATINMGADDFIEKLGGLRVLTNKVNAVLKCNFVIRKGVSFLSSDDLVIDKRSEAVYYKDREMLLSKAEFEILFFMMQNANKIVSRKVLVNIIWGSEILVLGSVEHCIESLQRKIGRRFIETVGSGQYRFNRTSRVTS